MANSEQEHRGAAGGSAQDRERAGEAGKKAGQHSHGGQPQHSQSGGDNRQQGGGQGGSGNLAHDRDRATDAGRKGGQR